MEFNGFTRSHFRFLALPFTLGGCPGPGQWQGGCSGQSISCHCSTPLKANLPGAVHLHLENGVTVQSIQHRTQGNDCELPLFPFSSTAVKSTPFSKRTEQMVGRSCWAARWRAVWRCLVNSFTLAPARSCWSWLHEQPLYHNQKGHP